MLTPDGQYNYIAYLLADENGVSIKVAKYTGTTKVDLVENEEYGYCSLIKAANHVLEKMKIENVTKVKVTSTKRIEKNLVGIFRNVVCILFAYSSSINVVDIG